MKPATWIGLAIIVCALGVGATALVKNISPYVTFAEARKASGQVQVMGKLDKKSIAYSTKKTLDFTLISDTGDRIPVSFAASRPANFNEAIQVTAIGKYDGTVFQADNLLVKCPSKYQGTETEKSYKSTARAGGVKI